MTDKQGGGFHDSGWQYRQSKGGWIQQYPLYITVNGNRWVILLIDMWVNDITLYLTKRYGKFWSQSDLIQTSTVILNCQFSWNFDSCSYAKKYFSEVQYIIFSKFNWTKYM